MLRHVHDRYLYMLGFTAAGGLDNKSQVLLDIVGDQDLRSLLILQQNFMGGGNLVSFEAIQQRNTDDSSWRDKPDSHDVP